MSSKTFADQVAADTADLRATERDKLERTLRYALEDARDFGFVVTVHLEPNLPLAMGNHRMVLDVRDAR